MDLSDVDDEIYNPIVIDFECVATAIFLHQSNSFVTSLRDPSFSHPSPPPSPLEGEREFL